MNIVAIGGGEIRQRETFQLDTFIRDLTGKAAPKMLFIPTASDDAAGYSQIVDEVYGKELGCSVDHLRLVSESPSSTQIEEQIGQADLIYVGGGNTRKMMDTWRSYGVDTLLRQKTGSDVVLAGVSAGAICWFEYGHSDSESFTDKPDWEYTQVEGLGLLSGFYCPHLDAEDREGHFSAMVQQTGIAGIGCDNNAAVWLKQDQRPVAKVASPKAGVYGFVPGATGVARITYHDGEAIQL